MALLVRQRNFQCVGLATNGDFPDYAVMYTIKSRAPCVPDFEYINPFVSIAGYQPQRADIVVADIDTKSMVDRATGVHYLLYRACSYFNILLPQGDPAL